MGSKWIDSNVRMLQGPVYYRPPKSFTGGQDMKSFIEEQTMKFIAS